MADEIPVPSFNWERVIVGVLIVIAMAIVIGNVHFRRTPFVSAPSADNPNEPVENSVLPSSATSSGGREYLVYNTPWAFTPPVGNLMPNAIKSNNIGANADTANFTENGCSTCQ